MAKKKKASGTERFEEFYSESWKARWPLLKEAMLAPKKYMSLENPFATADSSLKDCYYLDEGSFVAAKALEVKEGESVLDLCAAPGGKSLVLSYLFPKLASLVSNDRSRERRERLKKVFEEYLPEAFLKKVQVTGHDSMSWCLHEQEAYDKILLDAPCSSERHLLEKPHLIDKWSPKRSQRLAKNQYTMLASAYLVLKTGGRVVYSTCSISPLENEKVVEKLLKKQEGAKLLQQEYILPDQGGNGPIYFAVIEKS